MYIIVIARYFNDPLYVCLFFRDRHVRRDELGDARWSSHIDHVLHPPGYCPSDKRFTENLHRETRRSDIKTKRFNPHRQSTTRTPGDGPSVYCAEFVTVNNGFSSYFDTLKIKESFVNMHECFVELSPHWPPVI